MNTRSPGSPTVNARSLLLPYIVGLVFAMLIVQFVIFMRDGQIGGLAGALTGLVAVGIAAWLWRNHRRLTQVRFGTAIVHAVAFTTVTTSYNLHAVIRTVALGSGPEGFQAAAQGLLATPWFGATLMMSALWGVGLSVHLLGVILGRGWED